MMRKLALYTAPLMLLMGFAAHAACVYPQAPQNVPNGATATKDEMMAAQSSIKAYRDQVEQVYLVCLEKEKSDALAALDTSDEQYAQKKASIEDIQAKKNNAAVDELTALATRWSEEIKAFKAKGSQ
jgi:hypothetical protein